MHVPSRPRGLAALSVGGVAIGLVALLLAFPGIGAFAAAGPTPTSTNWEVGDGLATMSASQQVGARAYWDTYCPAAKGYCMIPSGVTYVPPAQLVLLTEMNTTAFAEGDNAFLEFDPATSFLTEAVHLNCTPWVPYSPGVGVNVLVPCWNGTGDLLAIDAQTARVVSAVVIPGNLGLSSSMAYDPASGFVYWGPGGDTIVAYDPVNNTVRGIAKVTDALFSYGGLGNDYQLVWDPATGQLVMPSASGGLIGVDPTTDDVEASLPLPAPAVTLALDPSTNQLFVSTTNLTTVTSVVLVFDAATYTLEATIAIPNCFDYDCAEPNEVNQVLFDPAHGDAYLVSTMAFIAVNLTTLGVVSALEDYGGLQFSSAFVPGLDLVFGTYEPVQIEPGFVVTVAHGSEPFLSQLVWLPTSVAVLMLAGVTGVLLAVFGPEYPPPRPEDLVVYEPLWPITGGEYYGRRP